MIKNVKRVDVKYNGRFVGNLLELKNNKIAFQYDDEWINTGFSISPFSLPLTKEVFISKKDIFKGLFGVFNDSLPDGWGELLVNRFLRTQGINIESLSPLTRLTLINSNGLGGLTYEPSQGLLNEKDKYNLDDLSKEIELILNDENYESLDEVYRLGGSSGGARPKAHIKDSGYEWIIKFPCRIDPIEIGKKEYDANTLAKKCGININDFKLFKSNICEGYFGAKRFDRNNNNKIHVISLAALLETSHRIPNLDYGHLFNVAKTLNGNINECFEIFRRMCFNVLYGNKDDHSKNFAFMYDEKLNKYILTPAYDITKTSDKFEHEMTINGNGNPTIDDMLELASNFNLSIPKCKEIIDDIKKVLAQK